MNKNEHIKALAKCLPEVGIEKMRIEVMSNLACSKAIKEPERKKLIDAIVMITTKSAKLDCYIKWAYLIALTGIAFYGIHRLLD